MRINLLTLTSLEYGIKHQLNIFFETILGAFIKHCIYEQYAFVLNKQITVMKAASQFALFDTNTIEYIL